MSGRNYTMTDEDREAMEALLAEEAPPRANVTLDPIEIRGRPDVEGDDALDVAESAERKGPAGMPAGMPLDTLRNRVAINRISDAARPAEDRVAGTADWLREFSESPTGTEGRPADVVDYLGGRRLPRLAAGATADLLESGAALPAGGIQGATLNLADDLYGTLGAAEGRDFDEARGEAREWFNEAREGSPGIYDMGHALGATGTALAVPAVGAESMLGRVLGEGALNAGMGAIEGAAGYEGDDGGEMAEASMDRALTSGAWGAGARLGLEGLGRGVDALRRFGSNADRLRVGSVMGGSGANPLSTAHEEAIARLPGGLPAAAERIRRLGISSTLGTAEDAAMRSDEALDRIDEELADYYRRLEEANPEGIPVSRITGAHDAPYTFATSQGAAIPHADRILSSADAFERAAINRAGGMPSVDDLAERYLPGGVPDGLSGEAYDDLIGSLRDRWMADLRYPIRVPPTRENPELGGLLGDFRMMREGLRWNALNPSPTVDRMTYRALRNELDDIAEETVGGSEAFRGLRNDRVLAGIVNDALSSGSARSARGLGTAGRTLADLSRFGRWAGLRTALSPMLPSARASAAETVRAILGSEPERLGVYAPIFARALERGGDDLLEAMVNRASEDDPELAATLAEPPPGPAAITDEAELDRLLEAPPVITDEAELDRLLNEGN